MNEDYMIKLAEGLNEEDSDLLKGSLASANYICDILKQLGEQLEDKIKGRHMTFVANALLFTVTLLAEVQDEERGRLFITGLSNALKRQNETMTSESFTG